MGTRGFISMAVLNVTAGLLITVAVLGGHYRPSSAAAPPAARPALAIPGSPTWAARVLDKGAAGTYVISWAEISVYIRQYSFDNPTGERNHKLVPTFGDSVRASIFPVANVWTVPTTGELFGRGHIVARIVSTGNFPALGLIQGPENYLFVWQSGRTVRMVVLNAERRSELKFHYAAHGDVLANEAPAIIAGQKPNPGKLSNAALECIAKGYKACFVDSQDHQIVDARASGMFQLASFQGGGGSQPWVSCVLLGCCCGGTNCHY